VRFDVGVELGREKVHRRSLAFYRHRAENAHVTRVALFLAAALLTGCGGSRQGASRPPLPPGAIVLRTLPQQGLIEEKRSGLALLDLHAQQLAWLRGFAVYPATTASPCPRKSS
jgi:hypothetical protein